MEIESQRKQSLSQVASGKVFDQRKAERWEREERYGEELSRLLTSK
jgi:hypothetical protein